MKKLAALLLLLLAAVPVQASGTRAADSLARLFTQAGYFGPPAYAADPFTCTAQTKRTIYYNTTSNTVKVCTGAAFVDIGGSGGVTAGAASSGCTASTLLWVDSGGLVQCGATATASAMTQLTLGTGASTSKLELTGTTGTVNGTTRLALSGGGNNPSYFGLIGTFLSTYGVDFDPASSAVGITKLATGVLKTTAGNGVGDGWYQNNAGEASLAANYTNATTTFSNTALSRTLISGRTYTFDLSLLISQSTAADGWKIDFNGNALGITNFVVNCSSTAETGIIVVLANATSAALATVINATTTVTTGGQIIKCHGSIVPSGSGTFIVRGGLNSITTGTLTIKRGSFLAMRDSPAL